MLLKHDTAELLQLAEAYEVAAGQVAANRPVVLDAIGVQNLSWAQQDYRKKSRGEQGGDGVTWAPVKSETVVGRLRKLKEYRTKSASVRAHRKKISTAKVKLKQATSLIRQSARGSAEYRQHAVTIRKARRTIVKHRGRLARVKNAESEREHTTATGRAKGSGKAIAKAKKDLAAAKSKRAEIRGIVPKEHGRTIAKLQARLDKAKASRSSMVNKAIANHRVGVDTGRQVNAITMGVSVLSGKGGGEGFKPRPGNSDPVPNAIFDVGSDYVTVGVNTKYAKDFDEDREIFGPNFHGPERVEKLEKLAAKTNEILLRQASERVKVGPGTVTKSDLANDV